ncbi:hypothetical protein AKJ47_00805 [candidate division MSBL1 archaeon SCGC-AAA261G05]|nr:hypothetical protein AKJ47_00805 [candidate division MSBL1 archaeon SCGC-AAA261G05]
MAKGKWQLRSKRSGKTYFSLTKARIERWIEERSSIEVEDEVGEKIGILRTDLEGEEEFLTRNLENESDARPKS